jgi:hypothetical protein
MILGAAVAAGAQSGQQTGQQGDQPTGQQTGQQNNAASEHGKPLELKPDPPGTHRNHRLILKDGSYQLVREYQTVGNRVRYVSVERGGDWEELPVDLVDWEATRKWELEHSANASDAELSPAMKEARALDQEEAEERDNAKARMPQVAEGLELPDEEGVFVLDNYRGTPALVELEPAELNINQKTRHGVEVLNPLAGQRASLELEGAHAAVHLHVNAPAIYISLAVGDEKEPVLTRPFTVSTAGTRAAANGKHGAHSPQSGFAIVHVDERREVRLVGAIHVSATGTVTQDENVIAAKVELLEGKHWLKLTPAENLLVGEYALVEILSPAEINQTVWDFRVDPRMGDNPGSLTPILNEPKR